MRRLLLLALLGGTALPALPDAPPAPPAVTVTDGARWHVHRAGQPLQVLVALSGPSSARARWLDAWGRPLGPPLTLRPGTRLLSAPAGPRYLQLAVATGDGPPRLFGFVRSPAPDAPGGPAQPPSPFGLVHAEPADPWLAGGSKTTTWTTFAPRDWDGALRSLAARGWRELPLVTGDAWDSDDRRPVGRRQLARLQARFRALLTAHRPPLCWELGLEENLDADFRAAHYFANLAAKTRALRAVADALAPGTCFVYQIAGLSLPDVQAFLLSEAAPLFDVLSLHPYPWPDFPAPAAWLPGYLHRVRQLLRRHPEGPQRLWITELGAPAKGLRARPELRTAAGERVHGLDRGSAADWLVQAHAIAFRHGVERLYWYHARDRDSRSGDPEDLFGLRDDAGFPKPAWAAYRTLQRALAGQVFWRAGQRGAARWYEFVAADGRRTVIAWADAPTALPLARLAARPGRDRLLDTVGTPRPLRDPLPLDRHPVFLLSRWRDDGPAATDGGPP